MKTRNAILLLVLLAASCSTKNRNSAFVITKLVEGTASGTPPVCTYNPGDKETDFVAVNPATSTGVMGVVLLNQLTSTSSLNTILRTDSTQITPHQVVADYEFIGGATITGQMIPVSGGSINAGGSVAVLTPFFFPAATKTLAGTIRVTFHVEGKLEDGSTVRSTEHEYIFVTAAASSPCL